MASFEFVRKKLRGEAENKNVNKRLSIYKEIFLRTGKKGWLPVGFLLPGEDGTPGQADGKLLYYTEIEEVRPEVFEKFIRLLKKAYQAEPKKRKDDDMIKYLNEYHVFQLIDRLATEICSPERDLDLGKILDLAAHWAMTSDNQKLVKLAIVIMGALNLDEWEEYREVIVALGKYEEFTFYSLFAVSGWSDAEKIARDYLKNLKGWGKTHAEVWLEPSAEWM